MTYYTCDQCDWAGPFKDANEHHEATGHDAFSRRDSESAEKVVEKYFFHYNYAYCDHSFTWMATIPPSHCPKCGVQLRPTINWPHSQPYPRITYGSGTFTTPLKVNTIPCNVSSSSNAAVNATITWNGRSDGPGGSAGLPSPKL